jgi:hypothetical protein
MAKKPYAISLQTFPLASWMSSPDSEHHQRHVEMFASDQKVDGLTIFYAIPLYYV